MQSSPRATRDSRITSGETAPPVRSLPPAKRGWFEPPAIADAGKPVASDVPRTSRTRVRAMWVAGALAVLAGAGALAVQRFPILTLGTSKPRPGSLTIDTKPGFSEVLVDGIRRGTTPFTLSLTPGAHTIAVRYGGNERVVPLTIASGAEVNQYFELTGSEPSVVVGHVSVLTDPPGAHVTVDGKPRGTSPMTVTDLTPAEHKVTVTSDAGSAERTVTVAAGSTASVVFSLPKASGPFGGWLSIAIPFDVEVLERDEVIGTSGASRIMLASGRHDITLVNRALGFQDARKVEVTAGKTTAIHVDPPKVSVSVNARPWADVILDGTSVGQTPIATLLVPVGTHESVFRHPQLAEQRQTVIISAKGPNRIAADLTK